jgi:hypothetical protein
MPFPQKQFFLKHLSGLTFGAVLLIILVAFLGNPGAASAVTRTWDGGGVTNNWSEDANWSGDTEPGVNDLATFDGTSTKNATIDTAISVGGITVNSGYTGVITQDPGNTVTVGTQNFVVSAGTFTGGNSTITITGSLTISGGSFTSTSGNLSLTGNFTVSSGSFEPSTGTMTAVGGTSTWNVVTTETVNNMTVAKNNGSSLFISSGDTIVVAGTLTLTDGFLETGTIDTRGNTTQASTFDGWDTVIDFGDDGVAQTYTINGGTGPHLRLDSAADANDSIVYAAAATVRLFTVTSGFSGTVPISNPSNFTLTFLNWSQSGGTFNGGAYTMNLNGGSFIIGSGATFNAPTTVVATSTGTTWDINVSQTFTNLTLGPFTVSLTLSSGDTLVTTGTLTLNGALSGGTINAQGNVVQNSGSGAGTTTINFDDNAVAQTYTINGGTGPILRFDNASDANDSLVYAAAGGLFQLITTSGFSGTIPISNPSNFAMSFQNWSQSGGDFTANYCGGTCSTMNLGGGTTTFTIASPATFTAPTTVAVSSTGMTFDVNSSQTFNNLSTSTTVALTISTGDTIVTNGTLTLTNGSLNGGTLNANGNVVQSSGSAAGSTVLNFANNSSAQTYTINGGTGPILTLDSASDASDSIVWAAAGGFFGFNVTSGFSGTVPISNSGNFNMQFRDFTLNGGTFNGSSFSNMEITSNGTATIGSGGTFNAPTTITNTGAGTTWNVNTTQTLTNFVANVTVQVIISSGDTLVATGNLTMTSGTINTGNMEVQGNVTQTSGGITSPLKFSGSGTQTVTLSNTSSIDGDVTVDKTGGQVNMANALVLNATNQDLTLVEGTFAIKGFALTVNGTSGTFVVQDGGVFERYGAETITLNASNPTLQTGSTVRYTGDGDSASDTYTITTLASTYSNLAIASTDGTADTFQLGAALDVNGNLTNSGTFTVTASNFQINAAGNWTNTGTFSPNSGTVIFDGTNQTLSGATTFNAFTKTVASAATLTFPASTTQTFSGTLTLQGASTSNRLSLRSSSSGVQATINPSGSRSATFLDVQDSNNANATGITCGTGCLDSGNNTNWLFPGVSVGTISGNTTEAGGTATFSVVLLTQPSANVVIPVSSNDTTEGTVAITDLTFTNGNWSTPQVVTVTGVNDDVDDGDIAYTIVLGSTTSADSGYNGLNPSDVSVTNTDNDTAGVTISESSGSTNVSEAGATDTYTIVLNSEPTASVTVTVTSDDDVDTTPTFATFTTGNWFTAQTITVSAVDDALDETDPHTGVLTHAATSGDTLYNGITIASVNANVADNDASTINVSAISGNTTEAGATATFTVVLTSQPSADVTMSVTSSDTTEITVNVSSLTFTNLNYATPQTVTVTGVNDDVDDGNQNVQVILGVASSADSNYNGVNPADVDVVNVDNDTAGVTITQSGGTTNVTEGGATDSYTVVLTSEPTANVTIDLTPDADVSVDDNSLTFTAVDWSMAQTITVTGVDDDIDETSPHNGVIAHAAMSSDLTYNGISIASVTANVTDNDTAGANVSSVTGNTTEAGGTASATIVLTSEPTASVSFSLTSLDTGEVTVTSGVTFTSGDWDTPQTITFTGVNDDVDDGDQVVSVTVNAGTSADPFYNGLNPADFSVTNVDDDGVGVFVSSVSGNTSEDGTTATFTVVLTSEPTANVTIPVSSSDTTEGTVSPSSLVFTDANWDTAQTVTITGVNDGAVDGDVSYTIVLGAATSADAGYNGINPADVTLTNTDNDVAGGGGGGSSVFVKNPSILINAGATCTATRSVTLTMKASNAMDFLLSNSMSFATASWQRFVPDSNGSAFERGPDGTVIYTMTVTWQISEEPGEEPVFVQYRSGTGNVSNIVFDAITYDPVGACGQVPGDVGGGEPGGEEEPPLMGISPFTGRLEIVERIPVGTYVRGTTFSTVYLVAPGNVRRPFYDQPTYFSYETTFAPVRLTTDATIASMMVGDVMLHKPGVTLLQFADSRVYAVAPNTANPDRPILRWIPNEGIATQIFGDTWNQYVVNFSPAFFTRFLLGNNVEAGEMFNLSIMKTRALLAGPDTDNDGLSDADEQTYGTDPNNPDTDGDGYHDGTEVLHGYSPLNAAFFPEVTGSRSWFPKNW